MRAPRPTLAAVLLAAGVLVAFPPLPAGATTHAITLAPRTGPPATQVTVNGRGFAPLEQVAILFDGAQVALAAANARGQFRTPFMVPANARPGLHRVEAIGGTSKLVAAASFLVQTDWPQEGFDPAHSRANPFENVLTPETVGRLRPAWFVPTRGAVRAAPVVKGGIVYVGDTSGIFHARRAATGEGVWSLPTEGEITQAAAVGEGMVFFSTQTGTLYGVDAASAEIRWLQWFPGPPSALALDRGALYLGLVGAVTPCMFKIDAATGRILWQVDVPGTIVGTPAVAGGQVVVATAQGEVLALDAASGQVRWRRPLGRALRAGVAVAGGRVFVGTDQGANAEPSFLAALDLATGAPLWGANVGPRVLSVPAVADTTAVVGAEDGSLRAYDAGTGQSRWISDPRHPPAGIAASPAVAGGILVGITDPFGFTTPCIHP